MKKLLIICILIVSIIFITGCTSNEQANSEISSDYQTIQKSDTPDLIIKSSDVSGLSLVDYKFYSVSKSGFYDGESRGINSKEYTDALPLGNRNVGECSIWKDESGRGVAVDIHKYDSDSGFNKEINELESNIKESNQLDSESKAIGSLNIGDYCYYKYVGASSPDVLHVELVLFHKNNRIYIEVNDEKEKSLDEATRIAEIVESRLD